MAEFSGEALSERELEIIGMAASGGRDKEIAKKLNLSSNTVRKYFERAAKKFGSCSRSELMVEAFESQQLDIDSFVNEYDLMRLSGLYPRERQVIGLYYKNRNEKSKRGAAAEDISISLHTIITYKKRAFEKLGIHSPRRAIVLGYAAHLRGVKLT